MHCSLRSILLTLVCGGLATSDAVAQPHFSKSTPIISQPGFHRPLVTTDVQAQLFLERFCRALIGGDQYELSNWVAADYGEIATVPASGSETAQPEAADAEQLLVNKAMLLAAARNAGAWHSTRFSLNKIIQSADSQGRELTLLVVVRERAGLNQFGIDKVDLHFLRFGQAWQLAAANDLYPLLLKKSFVGVDIAATSPRDNQRLDWWTLLAPVNVNEKTFVHQPLQAANKTDRLAPPPAQEIFSAKFFADSFDAILYTRVEQIKSPPYYRSIYVQLVTDPAGNRIVYGDYAKWIHTYTGGVTEGKLNRPQGIDRDSRGNIYVADTGNNRVLVLELGESPNRVESGPSVQGAEFELRHLRTVGQGELSRPFDVAWDDRGTPFDSLDDVLWIADEGNRRLAGYRLQLDGAKKIAEFTGSSAPLQRPIAVAVGRFNGASDAHIYLSDAGANVIYRLLFVEGRLIEQRAFHGRTQSQFTALATDHWGNLYVTDRGLARIIKLSPELEELAVLAHKKTIAGAASSSSTSANTAGSHFHFEPVFVALFNERHDKTETNIMQPRLIGWAGYDQAIALNNWSEEKKFQRYELGIDLNVTGIALRPELDTLQVSTVLTDVGREYLQIIDDGGRVVHDLAGDWRLAGSKQYLWDRRSIGGRLVVPGFYRLRHVGESTYGTCKVEKETAEFYLPLFYWEDSGAELELDAHLTQGKRSRVYGPESEKTVATDPQRVIYRFNELMPGVKYEARAEYFTGASPVVLRLLADGAILHESVTVSEVSQRTAWLPIDGAITADGVLEIAVEKTGGDGPASISQLWLREANFDPHNPPPRGVYTRGVPAEFELKQNYPNPFSVRGAAAGIDTQTTIEFGIPEKMSGAVTLRIYNTLGQVVRTLVDGDLSPGAYTQVWNGSDDSGQRLAAGIYFYKLSGADFNLTKKLVLMK